MYSIAQLGHAFNKMAVNLETSIEAGGRKSTERRLHQVDEHFDLTRAELYRRANQHQ